MGFRAVGEAYLLSQAVEGDHGPWPSTLDWTLALAKLTSLAEGRPMTHALEVALLAGQLAQALALPPEETRSVLQAALLHDVGLLPVLGRFTPAEETQVRGHEARLFQQSEPLFSGLSRHLNLPQPLTRLLHLNVDVPALVAYHHTMLNLTGLLPESVGKQRPSLLMNLVAFADSLQGHLGETRNRNTRVEVARHFCENIAPEHFYPELIAACHSLLEAPEAFKVLDQHSLSLAIKELYPGAQAAPVMNGPAVLALCRWLGEQVDRRQPTFTQGESQAVADWMVRLGKALKLPLGDLGQLALAGYLHDVGKLVIPRDLLEMDRSLAQGDEQIWVERHTTLMEEILGEVPGFGEIAQWIGAHHERLNGSGYPYKRRRAEIPPGAQLLGLVDTFVALQRPRPFRPAHRPQDAMDWLKTQQGRLFDPSLLDVLETSVRLGE